MDSFNFGRTRYLANSRTSLYVYTGTDLLMLVLPLHFASISTYFLFVKVYLLQKINSKSNNVYIGTLWLR